MKIKFLFSFLLLCFHFSIFGQEYTISGVVTDSDTAEPLIGATVVTENSLGTVTDFDGGYNLRLNEGNHTITISYVGYTSKSIPLVVDKDQNLDIKLDAEGLLNEVIITADIAIERETPVAFSNISIQKLDEELASQDIPMILNSTPGAYATESGGGDGDARINIRGFDQRNVAVMLDGIPVNDMENGQVYWSNWFGLDLVTQTIQVQRGLGASKLSIPSIGGTINILTKGIEAKRGLRLRQEVGNNGFTRTTLGLTSGRLRNGFGISAAASYKQGDGWVDANFTRGFFYYLRIDKQFGNHLISVSGFGAPQEHGQRPFTAPIAQVDTAYATKLGVPRETFDDLGIIDAGRRYNQFWGYKDGEILNFRKNYYHKPQFSLRHSWQKSERLFWSNVAYLSIGRGGGTAGEGVSPVRNEEGVFEIDPVVEDNAKQTVFDPFGKSETIIRSSNNEHFWYGLLSTVSYDINSALTLSGGIDARYYRGDHYRSVYDLLGGNGYVEGENNFRRDPDTYLVVGDRFSYDNTGFVRWGGLFGLLEYKEDRLSVFANVSSALTGYTMEDYMKPKVVELADTTLFVSYDSVAVYQDVTYTLDSPEAKDQRLDWINIPSFTFKAGASFDITEKSSIYTNAGYISKAQRFNNVINNNRFGNELLVFDKYDNEKITAFELGYSFGSPKFSLNFNSYYTIWENKPLDSPPVVALDESDPESERIPININGVNALHRGIELDFAVKPIKQITFEGLVSIGDWKWTSGDTVNYVLPNERVVEYSFDAEGVHVGDAAQLQLGGMLRIEPIDKLYIQLRGTYFGKNYADFQPEDLQGENAGRESWKLPSYTIFSFHTGYSFKVRNIGMSVRANIINLFDRLYITDARNNDDFSPVGTSDFDAKSATVHFGQGRRFNLSLSINL